MVKEEISVPFTYPTQMFVIQQWFKQQDVEIHQHCDVMLVHWSLGHVAVQAIVGIVTVVS